MGLFIRALFIDAILELNRTLKHERVKTVMAYVETLFYEDAVVMSLMTIAPAAPLSFPSVLPRSLPAWTRRPARHLWTA